VGDEMSNLGKKLQQHLDQSGPQSQAAADAQNALRQMAAAIDGAIEGVGNAVRDDGVRDTATKVAQSFRDALAVSLKKAGENLRGEDGAGKG
jgi:GTP cyclohydrolase I